MLLLEKTTAGPRQCRQKRFIRGSFGVFSFSTDEYMLRLMWLSRTSCSLSLAGLCHERTKKRLMNDRPCLAWTQEHTQELRAGVLQTDCLCFVAAVCVAPASPCKASINHVDFCAGGRRRV